MSDNIQRKNGLDCFAFDGERSEIWHRKGQQKQPHWTKADWRSNSGHDFEVEKVPLVAAFGGIAGMDHLPAFKDVKGWFALARKDDGHVFTTVTGSYQPVQPSTLDDFFDAYIAADPRFQLDAMGALGDGERIWATARFCDDLTVAGDRIIPRLLTSTSYDATMASRAEATFTRVVCQNTFRAALANAEAVIKVTHRTKFDTERVQRELAQIVASFDKFKAMGDAMAQVHVTQDECNAFLRNLLDIPLDAQRKDISTRSQNMFHDLETAINVTMRERNTRDPDLWCLLNGVTRYTDHDKSVRTDKGARDEIAARFDSSTFGAGDRMKGDAVNLLMPILKARQFA